MCNSLQICSRNESDRRHVRRAKALRTRRFDPVHHGWRPRSGRRLNCLLIELAKAGADIIEVGVPFSDPVADGKVIQRASERALKKGVTLSDTLQCVSHAKKRIDVPIVLFSYLNPLLKFGKDRLADEAKRAGINAVLVTDLIPEEAGPWIAAFRDRRMDLSFSRTHNVGRTVRAHRAAGERIYLRCFAHRCYWRAK